MFKLSKLLQTIHKLFSTSPKTLRLYHKDQPVNTVWGNSHFILRNVRETELHSMSEMMFKYAVRIVTAVL